MSWQGQKIIRKNVITGISQSFYFYGHHADAGAWSELTWIKMSFFFSFFLQIKGSKQQHSSVLKTKIHWTTHAAQPTK